MRPSLLAASLTIFLSTLLTTPGALATGAHQDPCAVLLGELVPEHSSTVWSVNSVPGSTRMIARCTDPALPGASACVALAEPKYPHLSKGGPYLAVRMLPGGSWTNRATFFTDNATVRVSKRHVRAKDIQIKGPFGRPGRFGGRGGFREYADLNLRTGRLSMRFFYSPDTIRLPMFIDWELMQENEFHCEIIETP